MDARTMVTGVAVALALAAAGCKTGGRGTGPGSPDGAPPPPPPPPAGDAGAGVDTGQPGGCDCPSGQVCSDGTCMPLPGSCPCPTGSYCDLTTNTCRAGCTTDEHCALGAYCETGSRQCRPGCRSEADCPPFNACVEHVCNDPCDLCADDGSPCTIETCEEGVCQHVPMAEGTPCADDGSVCTTDVCIAGECSHPPIADATPCSFDHSAFCLDGACTPTVRSCVLNADGSSWTVYPIGWPNATDCECGSDYVYVSPYSTYCDRGCREYTADTTYVACF